MKGCGGAAATPKFSARTRFLIGTFFASLIFGVVTFVAAGNIMVVRSYQFPFVSQGDGKWSFGGEREQSSDSAVTWSSDSVGQWFATYMNAGDADLQTVGLRWDWDPVNHYRLDLGMMGNLPSNDGTHLDWVPGEVIRSLDMVTRGLAASLFALVIGLWVLLTQRVRCVLRACYAGAPEPRPARYLALVSVLLPAREQQPWWRELCSTLAESTHRDRRRHSWSYLGSAPALILTSWCVHRPCPSQQTSDEDHRSHP